VDRSDIERHDFPVGRRGYDQGAVDAHLRRVADELDGVRRRAAATPALATGTSEQVREILEAAERSAVAMREHAEREAGEHVARVGEAVAAMMSRLDQLQRELDELLAGLRRSGDRLTDGIARLQQDASALPGAIEEPGAVEEPVAVEPAVAPVLDEPPDLSELEPADEAVPARDESAAGGAAAPDEAGARLIALNMALAGTPRDETARYLAEHYDLTDPEALLDDVYRRAGA
jgi:DivIVA domain-containing protein